MCDIVYIYIQIHPISTQLFVSHTFSSFFAWGGVEKSFLSGLEWHLWGLTKTVSVKQTGEKFTRRCHARRSKKFSPVGVWVSNRGDFPFNFCFSNPGRNRLPAGAANSSKCSGVWVRPNSNHWVFMGFLPSTINQSVGISLFFWVEGLGLNGLGVKNLGSRFGVNLGVLVNHSLADP